MSDSKPIAKSYLKKDGDESNVCLLFEGSLIVYFKSKKSQFPVEWIEDLTFKHKIFIIPIVFGGLFSSLSALALFQYNFNPWIMMSILFASIFTLYYGIQGGEAFVIRTPIKEYDFFTMERTSNMNAFIGFFNSFKRGYQVQYYLHLTPEEIKNAQSTGYLYNENDGIQLFTSENTGSHDKKSFQLKFNDEISIKYQMNSNNELIPLVFGKIHLDAFMI